MIFEANVAGVPVKIDLDALRPESRAFLLTYGVKQYVQDGAAVSKLHTKKELKGQEKTPDEIETEKREGVLERIANIESGTFTVREPGEPKMTREERERAAVIILAIETKAAEEKVTIPPRVGKNANKDWWARMTTAYYKKYGADVDKEVARRLNPKATKTVSLEELMAD